MGKTFGKFKTEYLIGKFLSIISPLWADIATNYNYPVRVYL